MTLQAFGRLAFGSSSCYLYLSLPSLPVLRDRRLVRWQRSATTGRTGTAPVRCPAFGFTIVAKPLGVLGGLGLATSTCRHFAVSLPSRQVSYFANIYPCRALPLQRRCADALWRVTSVPSTGEQDGHFANVSCDYSTVLSSLVLCRDAASLVRTAAFPSR